MDINEVEDSDVEFKQKLFLITEPETNSVRLEWEGEPVQVTVISADGYKPVTMQNGDTFTMYFREPEDD